MQPHMIDSILEDLNPNSPDTKPKVTLAPVTVPLQIFQSGAQPSDQHFYSNSVKGKLNFLEQCTRPDCAYVIHQHT